MPLTVQKIDAKETESPLTSTRIPYPLAYLGICTVTHTNEFKASQVKSKAGTMAEAINLR